MNSIYIAFTVNDQYIPYWGVCMASLLLHATQQEQLHVTLLSSSDISAENKRKIEKLQQIKPFTLQYQTVDASLFTQIPKSSERHISSETNYRFLMASLLPKPDKCIFLDADLVAVQNITSLWKEEINNMYLAAVDDQAALRPDSYVRHLPLPNGYRYVNTGVTLCNLKKWREDNIQQKLFENSAKYANLLKFPDQDVLNITLAEKIKHLSPRFNAMPVQTYQDQTAKDQAFADPVFIHYAGSRKPWDIPTRPYADVFWEYARQTPFYEELLFRMIHFQLRGSERRLTQKFSSHFSLFTDYYTHKILSKITWGKKRAHYKQKRDRLHEQVRQIRRFLKS